MPTTKLNAIDLFAGAGGITEGLKRAGFNVLLATDIEPTFSTAHRRNHPEVPQLQIDIRDIDKKILTKLLKGEEIHLITGGPPCQGFSLAGARREKDPRNQLFKHYIEILRSLRPKFFLMENVRGILSMTNGGERKIIGDIEEKFSSLRGYKTDYFIVNMADYGVPQARQRVIFIGNRLGIPFENCIPPKTHGPSTNKEYEVVWDHIKSLLHKGSEIPNHNKMNHSEIVKERMALISEGCMIPKKFPKGKEYLMKKSYQTVYQRLHRFRPAPTIVPGHMAFPIHPIENRSLTVREAARLQTFPDNYEFFGPGISQGLQVGNAVPPVFAHKLTLHIKNLILNNK